jgi:hypothetical protein
MLLLALPVGMRGDIDNRHKAVNDLMQRTGIVRNDSDCTCLMVVRFGDLPKGRCRVVIGKRQDILNFETPHPLVRAEVCGPDPLPFGARAKAA